MFYYVATKGPHGPHPYNFAMSADEVLMFIAEAGVQNVEIEVLDEDGKQISVDELLKTAAMERDAI